MRMDEIRREAESLIDSDISLDQKIELMKIEVLCELNSTLMFIKNNLR